MDSRTFEALLTADGQALLARAEGLPDLREGARLRNLTTLRRGATAELAAAALETAMLRRRAATKFARAAVMYLTRDALEQSSTEIVSHHRARRYAGLARVADLGCGIGGDTIALARMVPNVIAVDRDPVRLAMARENARAYGVEGRIRFVEADLRALSPPAPAAFFDPGRRTAGGQRLFDVEAYEPPLSIIRGWLPDCPALGVKVAPGVDIGRLTALGLDPEVEFLSVHGELREAALWFGPLRAAAPDGCRPARRATLLPAGAGLLDEGAPPAPVRPPGRYLLEPDPAVYRAGLLAELAASLGAWQIDATIAYLSTDDHPHTPFARAWAVEETLPFSVKGIRRRLRELRVGSVVVKKRGSPLDPRAFERMLKLDGPECRTVVVTRVQGRPAALICRALVT